MVHLALGRSNADLLNITGDLAVRFRANVIGIATRQPMQVIFSDGYYPQDIIDQDRLEIEKDMKAAESEFRGARFDSIVDLHWRSEITCAPLSDHIACEVRCADLLITSLNTRSPLFDPTRQVNTSDLVMRAGRPVLIVPPKLHSLPLNEVVVGWKDTRETRRAIADAMPFLQSAAHVSVVEVTDEEDVEDVQARLDDVVGWLRQHGVAAQSRIAPATGDDAACLISVADEKKADLIVAGAYGHSRLHEWVLGGVTLGLLRHAENCLLMSH
jgi:nucleotide-binding universal stress UspA family protein